MKRQIINGSATDGKQGPETLMKTKNAKRLEHLEKLARTKGNCVPKKHDSDAKLEFGWINILLSPLNAGVSLVLGAVFVLLKTCEKIGAIWRSRPRDRE